MLNLFKELSKRHNPHQIFNDFIELSALAISCRVDFKNRCKRESRYLEISKRYNKNELNIFTHILGELAIKLENPRDVLGDMLMELEEGNKTKGQYFTPFHICLMNAAVAFDEEKLKKDGFLFVNEPSCGGGALVIALYVIMKNKGYDPQTQLKVVARDLDLKSVLMCYVQLSLLGVPAVVYHMNTLSLECYSEWKTPFWVLFGWDYKKEVNFNIVEEECGQLRLV